MVLLIKRTPVSFVKLLNNGQSDSTTIGIEYIKIIIINIKPLPKCPERNTLQKKLIKTMIFTTGQ